ncbi:hypothetical protein KBB12_01115 [Candidatus Woesebacteria bacterium]|nr:hypothetical protein [Candidatus Woesebacteria bacterium]
MKKLTDSLQRYRYLLLISLCSALFVVIIQSVVTRLFSQATPSSQGIFLEDAVGEILLKAPSASNAPLISTLSDAELQLFQTGDVFEDASITETTGAIKLSLEKLLVSLDNSTIDTKSGVRVGDESISIKLNTDVDAYVVLCPGTNQPQNRCETYLVNKSGQSIPVTITIDSLPSNIDIRTNTSEDSSPSIFKNKPVTLDIRAI